MIPNPNPSTGNNETIKDFRDPNIYRFNDYKWILLLAAGDRIIFYSSWNLKNWDKLSEFGVEPTRTGNHDGVWECPTLIKFDYEGSEKYVILLSINPGGPNGGSVTQYFIGDFDGIKFTLDPSFEDGRTRYLDFGPDNYASIAFSGTRTVIGWMNNW